MKHSSFFSIYTCGMFLMVAALSCAGCAQVAYDTLQHNQAMECRSLQGSVDRDECMRRSEMSYTEYQRQLDKQRQDKEDAR